MESCFRLGLSKSLLLIFLALVLGPLGGAHTFSEAHSAGAGGRPLAYQGPSLPTLRWLQWGPQMVGRIMQGQQAEGVQTAGRHMERQQQQGGQQQGQQQPGQQTEGQQREGQQTKGQKQAVDSSLEGHHDLLQRLSQQTQRQRQRPPQQRQRARAQLLLHLNQQQHQQPMRQQEQSNRQQERPKRQQIQQLQQQQQSEVQRARAQLLELRAPLKCPARCKSCMPGNCKALTCCTQDMVSQRCTIASKLEAGCKKKKGPKSANCASVKDLAAGLATIQTMLSIQVQGCKGVKQYYTFVGKLTKQVVALRKKCC